MEGCKPWRTLAVACVCLILAEKTRCSEEVMHNLTKGFAKVLEECKKQENVGDHIMQDFYNFWHEEYELVNREMGCIIICMASKLELIGDDMKMHHGKAHDFAKAHGADDEVAKQLVTMIHECEKTSESIEDRCAKALETTKCFRKKIHGLQWAPSMRVIMEEVMTEI